MVRLFEIVVEKILVVVVVVFVIVDLIDLK